MKDKQFFFIIFCMFVHAHDICSAYYGLNRINILRMPDVTKKNGLAQRPNATKLLTYDPSFKAKENSYSPEENQTPTQKEQVTTTLTKNVQKTDIASTFNKTTQQPSSIINPFKIEQLQHAQRIEEGKVIKFNDDTINTMTDPIHTYITAFTNSPIYYNVAGVLPQILPSFILELIAQQPSSSFNIFNKAQMRYQPQDLIQKTYEWKEPSTVSKSNLSNLYMGLQTLNNLCSPENLVKIEQLIPQAAQKIAENKTFDDYVQYLAQKFTHVPNKLLQMYVISFLNDHANQKYATKTEPGILWGERASVDTTQPIPFKIEDLYDIPMPKNDRDEFDPTKLKDFQKLYLTLQALENINNTPAYEKYLEVIDQNQPVEVEAKKFTAQVQRTLTKKPDSDVILLSAGFKRADFEILSEEKVQTTSIRTNLIKNCPSYERLKNNPANEQAFEHAELDFISLTKDLLAFANQDPAIIIDKNLSYVDDHDLPKAKHTIIAQTLTFLADMKGVINQARIQQLQAKLIPTAFNPVEIQLKKLDNMYQEIAQKGTSLIENIVQDQMNTIFKTVHDYLIEIQTMTEQKLQNAQLQVQKDYPDAIVSRKQIIEKANNDLQIGKSSNLLEIGIKHELERKLYEFENIQDHAKAELNELLEKVDDPNKALSTLFTYYKEQLKKEPGTYQKLLQSLETIEQKNDLHNTPLLKQNFLKIHQDLKMLLQKTSELKMQNQLTFALIMFEEFVLKLDAEKLKQQTLADQAKISLAYEQSMPSVPDNNKGGVQELQILANNVQTIEKIVQRLIALQTKSATMPAQEFQAELENHIKNFNEHLPESFKRKLSGTTSLDELITMYKKIQENLQKKHTAIRQQTGQYQIQANITQALNQALQGEFLEGLIHAEKGITYTPQALSEVHQKVTLTVNHALSSYIPTLSEHGKIELAEKITKYVLCLSLLGGGVYTTQDELKRMHAELRQAFIQDITDVVIADKTGVSSDVIATKNLQTIGTTAILNKTVKTLAPEQSNNGMQLYSTTPSKITQFEEKYKHLFAQNNKGLYSNNTNFLYGSTLNNSSNPYVPTSSNFNFITPELITTTATYPSYQDLLNMQVDA